MTDSQKYYLDGFLLDHDRVTDKISLAIAKYGVAYKDYPRLENLGIDDRSIAIHCFFYNRAYEDHAVFLRTVRERLEGGHELLHPVFGTLSGEVESVSISYDERRLTAEVDLTFVIGDTTVESEPVVSASVAANCEESFSAAQTQQMEKVENDIGTVFGEEAGDLVTQEINADQTLLEQFTSITLAARAKLEEIDSAIYTCENYLSGVVESEAAFTSTIDYGTRLPGRLVSAITSALNRIAGSIYSESLAPSVYLSNLQAAFDRFAALFTNGEYPVADRVNQEIALRYALETSYVYDQDNAESSALRTVENTEPFDVMGRRQVNVDPPEIMTMPDLEESLYRARALLQAAIDRDRTSAKGFKDLATALLSFVEAVRLEREKIVSVFIGSEMPLFIVCIRNNLPIAYAERILSLNDNIMNPSFVSGEVKIYAR